MEKFGRPFSYDHVSGKRRMWGLETEVYKHIADDILHKLNKETEAALRRDLQWPLGIPVTTGKNSLLL